MNGNELGTNTNYTSGLEDSGNGNFSHDTNSCYHACTEVSVPSCLLCLFAKLSQVILAVVGLISLLGNIVLLGIIHSKRKELTKRHSQNAFIANLHFATIATADLIATIFFIPSQIYVNIRPQWLLGIFYCKLHHFLGTACDTFSVYGMMMLAISRNTAIASIAGSGITIKWTYIIIIITSLFSIGTSLPYLYYHEVIDIAERYPQNFTDNFQLCLNMSLGQTKQALIIFIFIIQFAIPFPIITSVYIIMLLKLRKAKNEFLQFRDTHLNNSTKVRPIERKIAICILFYVITWTPYSITNMIEAFDPDYEAQSPIILILWQVALFLRYAHYVNNPLTLILGSKTLRQETTQYLRDSFRHKTDKSSMSRFGTRTNTWCATPSSARHTCTLMQSGNAKNMSGRSFGSPRRNGVLYNNANSPRLSPHLASFPSGRQTVPFPNTAETSTVTTPT